MQNMTTSILNCQSIFKELIKGARADLDSLKKVFKPSILTGQFQQVLVRDAFNKKNFIFSEHGPKCVSGLG